MFDFVVFTFNGTLTNYNLLDRLCLKFVHNLLHTDVKFCNFFKTACNELTKFHSHVEHLGLNPLIKDHYRLHNTFKKLNLKWNCNYLKLYKDSLIEFSIPKSGVVETLTYIRSRYKTVIMTNDYDIVEQKKRICSTGLCSHFDDIIYSDCDNKDDTEIYTRFLEKHKIKPNRVLFVTDSNSEYVKSAKKVGLITAIISPTLDKKPSLVDHKFRDIKEIKSLLSITRV